MEGRTENFTPRGQNSPLGDNFAPGGQSLPLGLKLRMGLSLISNEKPKVLAKKTEKSEIIALCKEMPVIPVNKVVCLPMYEGIIIVGGGEKPLPRYTTPRQGTYLHTYEWILLITSGSKL
jgi:hypothetical protein